MSTPGSYLSRAGKSDHLGTANTLGGGGSVPSVSLQRIHEMTAAAASDDDGGKLRGYSVCGSSSRDTTASDLRVVHHVYGATNTSSNTENTQVTGNNVLREEEEEEEEGARTAEESDLYDSLKGEDRKSLGNYPIFARAYSSSSHNR